MYTVVPNKPFGSLLDVSPTNSIILKTFDSEFSYIGIWFTDQNSQSLEIDDSINLILVIKWYSYYESAIFNWTQRSNICKGYGFLSFAKNIGKILSNK